MSQNQSHSLRTKAELISKPRKLKVKLKDNPKLPDPIQIAPIDNEELKKQARQRAIEEIIKSKVVLNREQHMKRIGKLHSITRYTRGECNICYDDNVLLFALGVCMHRSCLKCINSHFKARECENLLLTCTTCNDQIKIKHLEYLYGCGVNILYYNHQKRLLEGLIKYANGMTPCILDKSGKRCTGYGRTTKWPGVLECDTCTRSFCMICLESHTGGCQADISKIQDKTHWLSLNSIVICPRCNQGIQRDRGCKWVQCKCNMNICTTCGQSSTTAHFKHRCI